MESSGFQVAGGNQSRDCPGLSFGRLFGAHLVHTTLQMVCFCATELTLSDSKQMKGGVYEQGRKISKPPHSAALPPLRGLWVEFPPK